METAMFFWIQNIELWEVREKFLLMIKTGSLKEQYKKTIEFMYIWLLFDLYTFLGIHKHHR